MNIPAIKPVMQAPRFSACGGGARMLADSNFDREVGSKKSDVPLLMGFLSTSGPKWKFAQNYQPLDTVGTIHAGKMDVVAINMESSSELVKRFDAQPGTLVLLAPGDAGNLRAALKRCSVSRPRRANLLESSDMLVGPSRLTPRRICVRFA